MRFLVSAGEASGDLYASGVANLLSIVYPHVEMYGCAGPKLQAAGVKAVVDASSLGVVGLAEVVVHLPRIYGEYRKLLRYARAHRPDAALLTDNPDFHLRLARHLKRMGVPVYYLVAPQVWAWRKERVKVIREVVDKLFCLFPFEEQWFRERGVNATYIGHPLASIVRARTTRSEFFSHYGIENSRPFIVLLPGSRVGEALRHLPVLLDSVRILQTRHALSFLLAMPSGFRASAAYRSFREPIQALSIQVIENDTWDCIAHAKLALAASGTVTVEAAVLGTPMVTFYKVNPLTWLAGRRLVKLPYLSMVNLIAERRIVPELIQQDMTAAQIASAADALLVSEATADRMRADLAQVRSMLTSEGNPFERAASLIEQDCSSRRVPADKPSHPQETIR